MNVVGVQREEEEAAARPEPQRAELEAQHVPLGLGAFHPAQRDLHGPENLLQAHVDFFFCRAWRIEVASPAARAATTMSCGDRSRRSGVSARNSLLLRA